MGSVNDLGTLGEPEGVASDFPGGDILRRLSERPEHWSGKGQHADLEDGEKVPLKNHVLLGNGSCGQVFKVSLAWGGKEVFLAKKRILRGDDNNIKAEIDILKKLQHRHIVSFIGSFTEYDSTSILLYPCAVCDLEVFLKDLDAARTGEYGPEARDRFDALQLSENSQRSYRLRQADVNARLRKICGCVTSAILYIHEQKIRHKDIKPSNILLGEASVYVTDFSISGDVAEKTVTTTTGGVIGTLSYMAPEVMSHFGKRGRKAEIYSLGLIFMEIFTYLLGKSREDMLDSISISRLSSMVGSALNFNQTALSVKLIASLRNAWVLSIIPQIASKNNLGIRDLLLRMLSIEPDDRPSAFEVASELVALDPDGSYYGKCCAQHMKCVGYNAFRERYDSIVKENNCLTLKCASLKIELENSKGELEGLKSELAKLKSEPTKLKGGGDTPRASYAQIIPTSHNNASEGGIWEKVRSKSQQPASYAQLPEITRNRDGYRLDLEAINYWNEDRKNEYQRIKDMHLCNNYYLRHKQCNCEHEHGYVASDSDIRMLKYIVSRGALCVYGGQCEDPKCLYGHHCLMKKGSCTFSNCKFMHIEDMEPRSWKLVR